MGISLGDALRVLPAVALMGGRFDPVHNGHLVSALDAKIELKADELRLLPYYISQHNPGLEASPAQRLAMLQQVVDDCAALTLDGRELQRSAPSRAVETLVELREELGAETAIIFVMGWDYLLQLPTWYRWRELLDFANIAVVRRSNISEAISTDLQALLQETRVDANMLRFFPAGKIALLDSLQLDISASDIRQRINSKKSVQFLVPDGVKRYIEEQGLYENHTCCNRR